MSAIEEARRRLAGIPDLSVTRNEPLGPHTRFGLGGPAAVVAETDCEDAFTAGLGVVTGVGVPYVVIGAGTNLVVADEGFPGVVLRYTGTRLSRNRDRVIAGAGARLDDLVEFTLHAGLRGLETLAGIPGTVGGAVYGNAGAYGHSISESVHLVRFHDGRQVRILGAAACRFGYRDSVFKHHRGWVLLAVELQLEPGEPVRLRQTAEEIRRLRNHKFPPRMRCAGSVFKNLLRAELPAALAAEVPDRVVREGKVPAAYFLDQVGARGLARGAIRVADFHANVIYNEGGGTAADFRALVGDLQSLVFRRFGIRLEEEVQYVGFPADAGPPPPNEPPPSRGRG